MFVNKGLNIAEYEWYGVAIDYEIGEGKKMALVALERKDTHSFFVHFFPLHSLSL